MRCVAAALLALLTMPALGDDAVVSATRLDHFDGTPIGGTVQGLIFEGGLQMTSDAAKFGGLSAIGFVGSDERLIMVSDRGNFVSGRLLYDGTEAPQGLADVTVTPIQNESGRDLPRDYVRDAEGLAIVPRPDGSSIARVSFEELTRVADFRIKNGVPTGPAIAVKVPDWISATRTNQSLESVCVAPPASPVAGSTLLLMEGVVDKDVNHSGWLLGKSDKGPIAYRSGDGTDPSDCAFLSNGDLLVLERGVSFLSFAVRLVRVKAPDVHPGAAMSGEVLFSGVGGDLDNMEGLAVHQTPAGQQRITLVSDDNFNDWERNLLLEFSLPQ